MFEDKTIDELLALYTSAIRAEVVIKMNINSETKPLDTEKIRQEILRRLQAGDIAQKKLQKFVELAREIDPNKQPLN